MEQVFKSTPNVEKNAMNANLLSIWQQLKPIDISEVLQKSKVNIQDLDLDNLPIKYQRSHKGYLHGMINRKTKNLHGLARVVLNSRGSIIEGWILNNHLNGFGRYINPNGCYSLGMHSNNRLNGEGLWVGTDGNMITGVWKDGKLMA